MLQVLAILNTVRCVKWASCFHIAFLCSYHFFFFLLTYSHSSSALLSVMFTVTTRRVEIGFASEHCTLQRYTFFRNLSASFAFVLRCLLQGKGLYQLITSTGDDSANGPHSALLFCLALRRENISICLPFDAGFLERRPENF